MQIPFKVICLDASGRNESIPESKWINKNEIYTVVKVDKINMQGGKLGFQLAEVDLASCFPYTYFGAWRFGVILNPEVLEEVTEEVLEEELL
jgi:hypothetical protein